MQDKKHIRNVLILMDDYLPVEYSMGGLAEHIRNLIKEFDNNYFFYIIGKNNGDTEYLEGDNFIYVEPDKTDFNINDSFEGDNDIMKQIILDQTSKIQFIIKFLGELDIKIDLVHVCDWSTGLTGVELSNYFNVPLLTAFHLSPTANSRDYIFGREIPEIDFLQKYDLFSIVFTIEEVLMKKSDIVTVVSKNYSKRLKRKISNECVIVPNGIELSDFKTDNIKKWGKYDDRPFKLLYIGRFSSQKGVTELFSINLPNDVELLMAGDDSHGGEDYLYDRVHYLDEEVDGFTYIGKVFNDDKASLFKYVDAVIMPSRHEPFGIVALEALASKTPLISSGVDGLGDFLTKNSYIKCGWTQPSLIESINKVKTMSNDEKRSLITEGMMIAKQYSWHSCRDKYFELYNKLIK